EGVTKCRSIVEGVATVKQQYTSIWDEEAFPTDPWTNTFVAKKMSSGLGWPKSISNNLADFKRGGIVGAFDLTNYVTSSKSPWFIGPYGLMVKNAEPAQLHSMSLR
ncbi:hypothetical protein, partial [Candidatus Chlorohelix sp.]|uniref:hypothetical protein n=1 Tax=Candidatus Chlorohelix sp. TaxID=3139201 RepID=UPI003043EE7A